MAESDREKRDRLRDEVGQLALVLGQRSDTLGKLRGELISKEAALNGLRNQVKAAETARAEETDNLFGLIQELAILEERMRRSIDISPSEPGPPGGGGPP